MIGRWNEAWENIYWLKRAIDNKKFPLELNLMTQRLWIMHWALYVFYNCDGGQTELAKLFFEEPYLNTIQTLGHHLLRYLTCAVLLSENQAEVLKKLIQV